MRLLITLTLCLIGCVQNLPAQKDPPPVKSTRPYEFVAEDGGFKVNFPSKPTRSVSSIDAAYGKTDYVTYALPTTLAFYGVSYLDFPTVIDDKTELRARYEMAKARLAANDKIRIVDEKEIFFGDYLGREFVYEGDGGTYTMRCLVVGQRFFQLIVGTRGSYINKSEKVNNYNRQLVDKFINSFVVTKIPAPAAKAVELPADFGISVKDGVFRSEFFKVSAALPADWRVTEQEENEIIKDLAQNEVTKELPKNRSAVDLSFQNSKILLMISKPAEISAGDAILVIVAERVAFPNFLPQKMTDDYPKVFVDANEKVVKPTTLEKINGVEFSWIEMLETGKNIKKRFYIANRGGIAFELFFTYENPADLETLTKVAQSLKFDKVQMAGK